LIFGERDEKSGCNHCSVFVLVYSTCRRGSIAGAADKEAYAIRAGSRGSIAADKEAGAICAGPHIPQKPWD